MPIPLAVMLGISGASALAGVLGNRSQKSQQTSESSSSSSDTASTSRRRYMNPQQIQAIDPLVQTALDRVMNPGAAVAPMRTEARNSVNASYAGLPQAMASKYLGFGGNSGKYAMAAGQAESSRLGQMSAMEPGFAQLAFQNQDSGLRILENLLGMNFGEDSTASSSSTSSSRASGTMTQPGNAAAGGIGSGASALASLLALSGRMGK